MHNIIPAKAGIQYYICFGLDSCLRRNGFGCLKSIIAVDEFNID